MISTTRRERRFRRFIKYCSRWFVVTTWVPTVTRCSAMFGTVHHRLVVVVTGSTYRRRGGTQKTSFRASTAYTVQKIAPSDFRRCQGLYAGARAQPRYRSRLKQMRLRMATRLCVTGQNVSRQRRRDCVIASYVPTCCFNWCRDAAFFFVLLKSPRRRW